MLVAYPLGTDNLQRAQLDQTYSQREITCITYKNMDQALLSLIVPAIDLMRNEQEMGKPYDPSQPIMILFAQITDGA